MADTYHAIVIGSGLAGLSAAFELTDGKRRVLIIEAANQVGGRTSNWKAGGMDVESGAPYICRRLQGISAFIATCEPSLKDVFIYQDEVEIEGSGRRRQE